jgi:pilus assembly protein CpaB
MKKYGTVIALGFAVVFGILAVILVNRLLSGQTAETPMVRSESTPMSKIVVASTDLNIGTRLTGENLALVDWPRANAPRGSFENISDIEGRVAITKVMAGTPIVNGGLAAPGSGAGLVAAIEPGMRAMAIQVNEVTGVGGFILPNTFVDVIAIDVDGKGAKNNAKTLLEKVEVLAIAQETYIDEGKAKVVRTVTLKLSPEDAESLALQTSQGSIQLVLRNPLDEVKPVVKKAAPVRTVRRRVFTPPPSFEVEIIRGEKTPEKYQFTTAH